MGRLLFGTEENVDCIADVALKGAQDEALCVAHKHSKTFFGAGVYLSDDGYVLGVKGKDAYYPMPTGAELSELQAEGLLPAELPPYEIGLWDYAWGYSLWIILGAMGLWYLGKYLLFGRRSEPAPDVAAP